MGSKVSSNDSERQANEAVHLILDKAEKTYEQLLKLKGIELDRPEFHQVVLESLEPDIRQRATESLDLTLRYKQLVESELGRELKEKLRDIIRTEVDGAKDFALEGKCRVEFIPFGTVVYLEARDFYNLYSRYPSDERVAGWAPRGAKSLILINTQNSSPLDQKETRDHEMSHRMKFIMRGESYSGRAIEEQISPKNVEEKGHEGVAKQLYQEYMAVVREEVIAHAHSGGWPIAGAYYRWDSGIDLLESRLWEGPGSEAEKISIIEIYQQAYDRTLADSEVFMRAAYLFYDMAKIMGEPMEKVDAVLYDVPVSEIVNVCKEILGDDFERVLNSGLLRTIFRLRARSIK